MHVDNTASFQNGDPPSPEEGALRYLCGDNNVEQLKRTCDESIAKHNILVKCKNVKAHQDKPQNREKDKHVYLIPLTQAALMNIDYDA